jgi:hypothetical protein
LQQPFTTPSTTTDHNNKRQTTQHTVINITMTLLNSAVSAYLAPLLKKHAAGHCITWEDLEASHQVAKTILQNAHPQNPFVAVR